MPGGGIREFRVVGDHLGSVDVPESGYGERAAGPEGEEGAAVRLVVDKEREGLPGVGGSDEDPVACGTALGYLWSTIRVQVRPKG